MKFRARLTAVRSSADKTVVQLTIEAPDEVPAEDLQDSLGDVVIVNAEGEEMPIGRTRAV